MNTHPLFQQKLDVLNALRARSAAARAEFRSKSRFYVEPRGDAWAVVDAGSRRLHGQCMRYPEAVKYAEQLERAVEKRAGVLLTVKDLADRMTRWASLFGLAIVIWATWGAA